MTDIIDLALGGMPVQTLSHKSSRVKVKKAKKAAKPKKPVQPRIVIVADDKWFPNVTTICKAIKALEPKTIEFAVFSRYWYGEKTIEMVLDQFKIPVIYMMPWMLPNSGYLQRGKIMKLFKPTMILAFAEKGTEDQAVIDFEKFARKADIDFKLVSK